MLFTKHLLFYGVLLSGIHAGWDSSGAPLGGCKENLAIGHHHADMVCETECEMDEKGRDGALNFQWLINTERNLAGRITVQNKESGFPGPDDAYIGIVRLDQKFCGNDLLHEIEANGRVQFDAGDKTNPNHWLESISFPHNVGENWERRGLFIQFRRGVRIDSDLISNNGLRDLIYIMLNINDEDILNDDLFNHDLLQTCLQKE